MANNKYVIIRNIATIIVLGNILYTFFPFRPVVWRLSMVFLSLLVLLFAKWRKTPFEKAVLVFAFFNLAHFFVSFIWINPKFSIIGNILYALLPLSMFTWLSQKGVMSTKFISILSLLLLIASIPHFFNNRVVFLERIGAVDEDASVTNNASGLFLFLIPMLFLVKNNIQKWAMLSVCVVFIILGAKRGNIIASIIPLILFISFELKGASNSGVKTFFVIVLLSVLSYLLYKWMITYDFLLYRWDMTKEGNSSGRDVLFAECWHLWKDSSNPITYLFGFGFDGTLQHINKYAHNDWLEILVDYGLIGIILYLSVFVGFVSQIKKTKDYTSKRVLWSVLAIWLFKTLYSMGYTEQDLILLMISVGTVLGKNNSQANSIVNSHVPNQIE